MEIAAVIPARMDSSRYPGKPLCEIHGRTMVEHVYERTAMSTAADYTCVATPDEEIRDEVEEFGGEVVMTGPHTRPVGRVGEAAQQLDADIIVTVQGDEPLVHPEMINQAVEPMVEDEKITCVNLTKEIKNEADWRDTNNVKVVFDNDWNALYFSREPIPALRDVDFSEFKVYKQVCIMPFRADSLQEYLDLSETRMTLAESIDMLRWLEHGHDVKMIPTDYETYAVDTPADQERVIELMESDPISGEY